MKIIKKTIFTVLIVFALMANLYSNESDKTKTIQTNDSIQPKQSKQVISRDSSKVFTCSMHSKVISNKSGNCSKCGMELVLKNSGTISENH
ncbi:MAG: hypothetical protein GZ094_20415 [Mariniphaga sp.]|nr:hypothetical protein [Mariniphaga sp.]